jgi:glycosyltransferase-like protein
MFSVGLLTYSTKPRGSVVHAACLAEALTRLGIDTTLYALSKAGDGFFRDLSCKLQLLPAGPAPAETRALIRQRIGEVAHGLAAFGERKAVYHAEDCLSANGLVEAQSELQPALVARTVHHVERFQDPYLAACQRRSVLEAQRLFVVSRLTEREVLAEYGRRSVVISNGVDLARFSERDPKANVALRQRLGLNQDGVLVLSVGGVEPRKNTLAALEAVARVHAAHPDLVWAIAGGASIWDHSAENQAFSRRLAELSPGLARRIVQLGTIEDAELTSLYRAAHILLCPSRQEGFGLCVLEALAAHTAVVVSDREPFVDWLDSNSARFVDPDSVDSIAAGLLELVRDASARERFAVSGRAVAERHAWQRVAEAHITHYERWLERRDRARPALHT